MTRDLSPQMTRRRQTLARVAAGARWYAEGFAVATGSAVVVALAGAVRNGALDGIRVDTLLRFAAINLFVCTVCAAVALVSRVLWRRTFRR